VVPPHTAPRRHRTPVGAQSVEEEEDTGLPRFEFAASFWAVREDESDARDFYDTEDVFRRRLAVDWKRCVAKERFKDFLVKEDKRACEERGRREALAAEGKLWDAASVGGGKDSLRQRTQSQVVGKINEGHDLLLQEKANPSLLDHLNARELTAMKKLLEKQDLEKLEMEARQHEGIVRDIRAELRTGYPVLCSIHAYYSVISGTTGDTFFSVKMVGWREFLEDACLPDAQSDACKQEDCDRVFMAANAGPRPWHCLRFRRLQPAQKPAQQARQPVAVGVHRGERRAGESCIITPKDYWS